MTAPGFSARAAGRAHPGPVQHQAPGHGAGAVHQRVPHSRQRRAAGAPERASGRRGAAGAAASRSCAHERRSHLPGDRCGCCGGRDCPSRRSWTCWPRWRRRSPGPLALLYAAGVEAGLRARRVLARGAGIFLSFAAGNLADDFCDGECDYYSRAVAGGAVRAVPPAEPGLGHAGAERRCPVEVLAEAALGLAQAAGPQALEVRTRQWTAPVFRQVAEGIAGQQWASYLRLLWAGTRLVEQAGAGRGLGIAAHVAEDIRSRDWRFFSMPEADQREVVRWARAGDGGRAAPGPALPGRGAAAHRSAFSRRSSHERRTITSTPSQRRRRRVLRREDRAHPAAVRPRASGALPHGAGGRDAARGTRPRRPCATLIHESQESCCASWRSRWAAGARDLEVLDVGCGLGGRLAVLGDPSTARA